MQIGTRQQIETTLRAFSGSDLRTASIGLLKERLEKIAKHFASEKNVGPRFVADFEEITDPEERELRERDAYEKVDYILQKLGIV